MKPIRATVMIDELIAAKTRVAELTEKVVASLTEAAGKLGFTLVPGGAHPLTDGDGTLNTFVNLTSGDVNPDKPKPWSKRKAAIVDDVPTVNLNRPPARRAVTVTLSKKTPFACPHCSRTFALPLHLGRHMTATHKVHPGGRSVSRHSAQRRGAVRVVVDHKTTPRSRRGR